MENLKSVYSVSYNSKNTLERVFNNAKTGLTILKSVLPKNRGLPIYLNGDQLSSKKELFEKLSILAAKRKRLVIKAQACTNIEAGFEKCIAVQTWTNNISFEKSIYCRKGASYTYKHNLITQQG